MRRSNVAERLASVGFDEIFDGFMRTATPVILRGIARDWPARSKWTADFLVENYGCARVDFSNIRSNERVQRPLAEYFSLPADDRANWYVTDWDFRRRYPELLEDIDVPDVFALDWMDAVPPIHRPDLFWIYVGHAGTRGPTHVDNYGTSAWLAVLQGVKEVVFPIPIDGASLSSVDFFTGARDFQNVAELAACSLEAGDVLYVPAGRWHAAYNPDYCLSVTTNFVDGTNFCDHRGFASRHWFGRRMLEQALDTWRLLPPGVDRRRLERHLGVALETYRSALEREKTYVVELAAALRDDATSEQ